MNLNQWAIKWGVPFEAVEDLRRAFGVATDPGNLAQVAAGQSEAAAQAAVRLEASRLGHRLWRNNSGACYDEKGNFTRYGLGNDSEKLNKIFKTPDLVGVKRVVIQPEQVGQVFGQILMREMKPPGWQFTGTDREAAQLRCLEFVASMGGDACFATGEGTL